MSEPIKVGDLVVVVRAACTNVHVGYIFRVGNIRRSGYPCENCKTLHNYPMGTFLACEGDSYSGFEFDRLKRIPPISELEGQPTQEDIKEPA